MILISSATVNLCPARAAGAYLLAHEIARDFLFEVLDVEGHLWPRADERHIPLQHIEELWQLVEAELADKAAEVGLAGVVVGGPACLLLHIDPHGAELVHHEGLFV